MTSKSYIQGLPPKNFPKASYDLQPILMHETIDSLVASIRAEAATLTKAQCSSRYVTWSQRMHVTLMYTRATHVYAARVLS